MERYKIGRRVGFAECKDLPDITTYGSTETSEQDKGEGRKEENFSVIRSSEVPLQVGTNF